MCESIEEVITSLSAGGTGTAEQYDPLTDCKAEPICSSGSSRVGSAPRSRINRPGSDPPPRWAVNITLRETQWDRTSPRLLLQGPRSRCYAPRSFPFSPPPKVPFLIPDQSHRPHQDSQVEVFTLRKRFYRCSCSADTQSISKGQSPSSTMFSETWPT